MNPAAAKARFVICYYPQPGSSRSLLVTGWGGRGVLMKCLPPLTGPLEQLNLVLPQTHSGQSILPSPPQASCPLPWLTNFRGVIASKQMISHRLSSSKLYPGFLPLPRPQGPPVRGPQSTPFCDISKVSCHIQRA